MYNSTQTISEDQHLHPNTSLSSGSRFTNNSTVKKNMVWKHHFHSFPTTYNLFQQEPLQSLPCSATYEAES